MFQILLLSGYYPGAGLLFYWFVKQMQVTGWNMSSFITQMKTRSHLRSLEKELVMALGCYKNEVVMILIQSKVDSFPSL